MYTVHEAIIQSNTSATMYCIVYRALPVCLSPYDTSVGFFSWDMCHVLVSPDQWLTSTFSRAFSVWPSGVCHLPRVTSTRFALWQKGLHPLLGWKPFTVLFREKASTQYTCRPSVVSPGSLEAFSTHPYLEILEEYLSSGLKGLEPA